MNTLRELARDLLLQSYQTEESFSLSPKIVQQRVKHIEEQLARHFGAQAKSAYVDQLIRIALHLSQRTYSGYYSLSFNAELREIPLSENIFHALPQLSEEYFYPELYHNDILSVEEKASLKKRHDREFSVLKQTFLDVIDFPYERPIKFFRSCDDFFLQDSETEDAYSQCYNQVCIKERFGITKSLGESNIPTFSSPALTQIILDGPPGRILQTYCMPTKDLLISMTKDGTNPLTGTKYSRPAVDRVRSNFPTELKLVEYALKISPKLQKAPYSLTQTSQAFMYRESKSPRQLT